MTETVIIRTTHVNYNNYSKRLEYNMRGELSKYTFLDNYCIIENSNKSPLCVIIGDIDNKREKSNSMYIFNIGPIGSNVKNIDKTKFLSFNIADNNTKTIYVELNEYISKILSKSKIEYSTYYITRGSKFCICFKLILENYILMIEKKINFEKQYLKNFNNISNLFKEDFRELLNLSNILNSMNINKLDNIIENVIGVKNNSNNGEIKYKLIIPSSRFNNLKIIYNNYNEKRNAGNDEIELFDSLNQYVEILKKNNSKEVKIIQLRGVRFLLSNNIRIEVYPCEYYISNIPYNLKKYILSVCNINHLKSEIEKIIIDS